MPDPTPTRREIAEARACAEALADTALDFTPVLPGPHYVWPGVDAVSRAIAALLARERERVDDETTDRWLDALGKQMRSVGVEPRADENEIYTATKALAAERARAERYAEALQRIAAVDHVGKDEAFDVCNEIARAALTLAAPALPDPDSPAPYRESAGPLRISSGDAPTEGPR